MGYSVAVFDLDGTVLDTIGDLAAATDHALASHGLPALGTERVRAIVGNGIRNLIETAVPAGTDRETTDAVFAEFKSYYAEHCQDATRPYDGIEELLASIRDAGVRTALVSNKADFAVQKLVAHFLPGLFDVVVGEREGVRRKPAPDALYAVLAQLGHERSQAVYVGDSEVDIETARNAGVDCLVVGWGYRSEEFLEARGARVIVGQPGDLKGYIL
ncbi:MAG: HAD-IA family hydrolase [Atopobiaceae bacterium]|jgi:phosphoglycolate phosphatase|nr:HAD-IA family hydrolase [Atopobiaceae bacterium]